MSEILNKDKEYVAGTYARFPVEIVSGKGCLTVPKLGQIKIGKSCERLCRIGEALSVSDHDDSCHVRGLPSCPLSASASVTMDRCPS